jgi:hypothetical protein
MAYLNPEDRRAYARAHYQANKSRYNPGRKLAREMVPAIANDVLELSEQRFIYPDELPGLLAPGLRQVHARLLEKILYEERRLLPVEAKTYGLFLRRPPFAYHPDEALRKSYLRQLSLIPKSKRGIKAELLILNFVMKDM